MDVGAAIEQQRRHSWRAADDRAVQRRAAGAVAAVHERRIGVEERAHLLEVAGFRGEMNRMVRVRRGRDDAIEPLVRVFDEPRDVLEPAIPCRLHQGVAPAADVVRRRTGVQQHAHGFDVPGAHGIRKRLRQVVPASDNAGIAIEQPAQRRRVAAGGGGDGRADVAVRGRTRLALSCGDTQ